jgi:hypothetical protein
MLQGGLTLLFDNFGRLKYAVSNAVSDPAEQSRRLQDLWDFGYFQDGNDRTRRFSALHRRRSIDAVRRGLEAW